MNIPFKNENSIWNFCLGMVLDGLIDDIQNCPWRLSKANRCFYINGVQFQGDKWESWGSKVWMIEKNEHSNKTDNLGMDPLIWGPPIKERNLVIIGEYYNLKAFCLYWLKGETGILADIEENKNIVG